MFEHIIDHSLYDKDLYYGVYLNQGAEVEGKKRLKDDEIKFNLTRNEAKDLINEFVKSRKFFAHPKFKKEFTTDNIMGAYFPYMIVDVNSHGLFAGKGEHEARRYTRGQSDNKKTYYDADVYSIEREFDFTVEGLTIESSSDKLNKNSLCHWSFLCK